MTLNTLTKAWELKSDFLHEAKRCTSASIALLLLIFLGPILLIVAPLISIPLILMFSKTSR